MTLSNEALEAVTLSNEALEAAAVAAEEWPANCECQLSYYSNEEYNHSKFDQKEVPVESEYG